MMPLWIAVAGRKGGVGKTTLAWALATRYAGAGRRVLLVDMDPQASASLAAGAAPGGACLAAGTLIRSLDAFDRALADVAALDMTRAQRNARKDAAALGAALRRLTTRQKP